MGHSGKDHSQCAHAPRTSLTSIRLLTLGLLESAVASTGSQRQPVSGVAWPKHQPQHHHQHDHHRHQQQQQQDAPSHSSILSESNISPFCITSSVGSRSLVGIHDAKSGA